MITLEIIGERNTAVVFGELMDESAVRQIEEICGHPAFEGARIRIMPDCHAGKGCVIGFTAVTDKRMIVPNIVGFDIGCGILTTLFRADREIDFHSLDSFIRSSIPSGMNIHDSVVARVAENNEITDTVRHICDIINESENADYHLRSVGTLGGGNHFIEVDRVGGDLYALTVHTGSRNLGKRICDYFQGRASVIDMELRRSILAEHRNAATSEEHEAIDRRANGIVPVSRDLAFITGERYDMYIDCMLGAKAVAAANRAVISDEIMSFLAAEFGAEITDRFDTVHNYIDWYDEEHTSIVIRKGAISAQAGERVVIPLNMRDGVIIARGKGSEEWNRSAPHGSGRAFSRSEARSSFSLEEYAEEMSGIHTWSVSESTIDECPMAYKPSDMIIKSIADTAEIECVAHTIYNFKA
ncbi:MAG: RtcB family protein [Oscillospiraceae bacterium]